MEDDEIRNEVISIFKKLFLDQIVKQEMQEIMGQVESYKEQLNKELEFVHQKYHAADFSSEVDTLLDSKYPDADYDEWNFEDKDGTVYGWPENISVNLFTTPDGKNYIFHQTNIFDKDELALTLRIKKFYELYSGCDSELHTLVFCRFLAANTRFVAQQSAIELIIVN